MPVFDQTGLSKPACTAAGAETARTRTSETKEVSILEQVVRSWGVRRNSVDAGFRCPDIYRCNMGSDNRVPFYCRKLCIRPWAVALPTCIEYTDATGSCDSFRPNEIHAMLDTSRRCGTQTTWVWKIRSRRVDEINGKPPLAMQSFHFKHMVKFQN